MMGSPFTKRFRAALWLGLIWSIVLGIAAVGVAYFLFSVVGIDLPPTRDGQPIPLGALLEAAALLGNSFGLFMGILFGLYLAYVNRTRSLLQLRLTRMAMLGGLAGPSVALLLWVDGVLRHKDLGFIPLAVSAAGIGLLTVTGACLAAGTVRIAQRTLVSGSNEPHRLSAT